MSESYWERLTSFRISRRRALQGAAALGVGAAAVGVVGCGGGGGSPRGVIDDPTAIVYAWQLPDETANAVPGGIRRDMSTADITGTLDPMVSPSFTTVDFMAVVYETLLRTRSPASGVNPNTAEGVAVLGRLAEDYEVSNDAMTYTLRMRPNVKFHNVAPVSGRTMDIEDWRTSYERYVQSSPFRTNLTEIVDSVQYPDNRTMVFRLKEPSVAFLRALTSARSSFLILPKELNANPSIAATSAIGTNYRILDRIQPSIGREYRKHPEYWDTGPFMDRWTVPIIPEAANRRAQFVTGNVLTYTPPQSDVLQLRADYPTARMLKGDIGQQYWYSFFGLREFTTSPWRDERVRIAMRMSVDWDAVRAHFSNSREFEAAGVPVDSRQAGFFAGGGIFAPYWLDAKKGEYGAASKNLLYDVAEARRLMSAAGYANGIEFDGFLNGGNEYGTTYYHESVQVIADEMQKTGLFRINLQRTPYAEYLPRIYQQRDFKGLSINHPEFVYAEIDLNLFNWYHTNGARRKWITEDRTLDDMIMRQRRELDENRRISIIADIQKYMAPRMEVVPGDGNSGGYGFRQPWVRNGAFPENLWWLEPNAPNRG